MLLAESSKYGEHPPFDVTSLSRFTDFKLLQAVQAELKAQYVSLRLVQPESLTLGYPKRLVMDNEITIKYYTLWMSILTKCTKPVDDSEHELHGF